MDEDAAWNISAGDSNSGSCRFHDNVFGKQIGFRNSKKQSDIRLDVSFKTGKLISCRLYFNITDRRRHFRNSGPNENAPERGRSHIKNLRRKLEAVDPQTDLIRSVYGVGFRLELSGS